MREATFHATLRSSRVAASYVCLRVTSYFSPTSQCHLPHILSSQCLCRGHPTNTALRSQSHSAASASRRRQSPFWQSRSPPLARLTQRRISSRTWLLMWKADRWSLLTQRFRRSQTLPEFGSCTSFQSCNRRAARKRSRPRSSRKKRRS